MATGKANWPLGMTVRSTHHAIGSGLFREPRFGVFAGMSRSGLVRVILDGETTPRAYHPRFWRKAPSLHPAQPSQDVAGTSSESLAGLSKEGSETP